MSPTARAGIALALMAGFYVLAIGSGIGLIGLAWWLLVSLEGGGAVKIALLSAIAGGTVLYSLRPRRDNFEPPGPRLSKDEQPELFAVIEDIARTTNQEMPIEVYALPDVNAWVSTRGGTLGLGGRRVMGLGVPLLHLLTVDQLKAVIAHEFGHYGGGDTRIGRLVYHTRLGLGRTMTAVEGKMIAQLFELYGTLVMKVSSAVARQQEFAADAFAARATSAQDLVDSLEKLDRHGPLLPLFYSSNMHAVIEEGYWAPIGTGFSAFCALLVSRNITLRQGVMGEDGELVALERTETAYDSHPPTEQRVAALHLLEPAPVRVADNRVAGSLLRKSSQIEFELFKPARSKVAKLTYVPWEDVTPKVLVPRWQRIAREGASILKQVHIESPPAAADDLVKIGRAGAVDARVRAMQNAELMQHVVFTVACGVVTRLMEKGWTPIASPNLFCEFERGEARIEPLGQIVAIAEGRVPIAVWAEFCAKESLAGPLAD